ncbi:hypothetical protein A2W24_07150 [Microgenomates group bacterium RBG_16_45_19]|nr:MAG: hypothetical protein A2W24_07150 [Microgenomates group bacterium RBG_16_45_19]
MSPTVIQDAFGLTRPKDAVPLDLNDIASLVLTCQTDGRLKDLVDRCLSGLYQVQTEPSPMAQIQLFENAYSYGLEFNYLPIEKSWRPAIIAICYRLFQQFLTSYQTLRDNPNSSKSQKIGDKFFLPANLGQTLAGVENPPGTNPAMFIFLTGFSAGVVFQLPLNSQTPGEFQFKPPDLKLLEINFSPISSLVDLEKLETQITNNLPLLLTQRLEQMIRAKVNTRIKVDGRILTEWSICQDRYVSLAKKILSLPESLELSPSANQRLFAIASRLAKLALIDEVITRETFPYLRLPVLIQSNLIQKPLPIKPTFTQKA